jgi:hypothetical protein
MSSVRSADEARANYVAVMGEPLGSLFYALWQEVSWLYCEWHEYVALFGTKPSRVTLLNEAAPVFFRLIQDSLWEGTLLHITRLTDPPKSFDKHKRLNRFNLTIRALAPMISDRKAAQKVSKLTQEAVDTANFCRDWRNRRIAHRDRNLALSTCAETLKSASRNKVKVSLDSITEVLNVVSLHYMGSTNFFDVDHSGGAVSLLHLLDDGVKAVAERRERIHRGEIHSDDFPARDV